MTPRALAAALLLAALPAAADDYDCAVPADKKNFASALADLKAQDAKLYRGIALKRANQEKDGSDTRFCTVAQWCVNLDGKVKLSARGGNAVMRVYSAPASPCPKPWAGSCEKKDGPCTYATEPLVAGEADSAARVLKAGTGTTVSGKPPAWEKSSGNKGDFDGPAFTVKDYPFKVRPKDRAILRRLDGGALEDTGQALPEEVYEELCQAAGCPAKGKGKKKG